MSLFLVLFCLLSVLSFVRFVLSYLFWYVCLVLSRSRLVLSACLAASSSFSFEAGQCDFDPNAILIWKGVVRLLSFVVWCFVVFYGVLYWLMLSCLSSPMSCLLSCLVLYHLCLAFVVVVVLSSLVSHVYMSYICLLVLSYMFVGLVIGKATMKYTTKGIHMASASRKR